MGGFFLTIYYMPKKSFKFPYSESLYKAGQDFLDIQYESQIADFFLGYHTFHSLNWKKNF